MRRLDWQLVRPMRSGDLRESMELARILRRLVTREAADALPEADGELLDQLELSYDEDTVSTCEAVGAPVVQDDPGWESRVVDEFAESDVDMELEEFLELRKAEPDCERCPHASPYSLYPMDACEFSAGALEVVLTDAELRTQAARPMDPDAMRAYAAALDAALAQGHLRQSDALPVQDYVEQAARFLRFWADRGFGILPGDIDEIVNYAEPSDPGRRDEDEGPSPTYH
ncbi:MAG: hypothetical protein H6744_04800 [Deltaproteobacteria bacterium]|nr:hypothetical protein [Deltaproteobacteria bacterium]MCB9785995.1 hypothetical protein [Deltaproteobacteria bacterium]